MKLLKEPVTSIRTLVTHWEENSIKMQDLSAPKHLEIIISQDGKKVWINEDGICRFRASRIQHLILNDERHDERSPK